MPEVILENSKYIFPIFGYFTEISFFFVTSLTSLMLCLYIIEVISCQ